MLFRNKIISMSPEDQESSFLLTSMALAVALVTICTSEESDVLAFLSDFLPPVMLLSSLFLLDRIPARALCLLACFSAVNGENTSEYLQKGNCLGQGGHHESYLVEDDKYVVRVPHSDYNSIFSTHESSLKERRLLLESLTQGPECDNVQVESYTSNHAEFKDKDLPDSASVGYYMPQTLLDDSYIDRYKEAGLEEGWTVVKGVLTDLKKGYECMDKNDIVHGDTASWNIRITQEGRVVYTDFDTAYVTGDGFPVTRTNGVVNPRSGFPAYDPDLGESSDEYHFRLNCAQVFNDYLVGVSGSISGNSQQEVDSKVKFVKAAIKERDFLIHNPIKPKKIFKRRFFKKYFSDPNLFNSGRRPNRQVMRDFFYPS